MYDFNANIPKEDIEYFGANDGLPMTNVDGHGVLS